MRKSDELSGEHTCMGTAHPREMVFVMLSRDAAAPAAIRFWVSERIRLGKNVEGDAQTTEALECARVMEEEHRLWTGPFPGLTQRKAAALYEEMCDRERGDI